MLLDPLVRWLLQTTGSDCCNSQTLVTMEVLCQTVIAANCLLVPVPCFGPCGPPLTPERRCNFPAPSYVNCHSATVRQNLAPASRQPGNESSNHHRISPKHRRRQLITEASLAIPCRPLLSSNFASPLPLSAFQSRQPTTAKMVSEAWYVSSAPPYRRHRAPVASPEAPGITASACILRHLLLRIVSNEPKLT